MKARNCRMIIGLLYCVTLIVLSISCKKEVANEGSGQQNEKSEALLSVGAPNLFREGYVANDIVLYWNEKAARVLNVHTNPGADARFFAIIQIAVHDALNAIIPKYASYALNLRDKDANPDAAVASAAYWAIKGLNRQGSLPVNDWYNESLSRINDSESKERGIQLGRIAAETIIANRASDGISKVLLTSLMPPDGTEPGEYRSTLPFSNPALNLPHLRFVPNWGEVMRPFVTQTNYQFRPPGPHPVNSNEYTVDYNEVKEKGALIGSTRSSEEEQLAVFWSDLRQHTVWNSFTRQVINTKKSNFDAWKTARLFALVHTAMADGASAMLEAVYYHYHWRPETAIRIESDGNTLTIPDPAWLPSIIAGPNIDPIRHNYTPNVPEYPSTFAIQGGITGRILQTLIGSDEVSIQLTSEKLPNSSRPYASIWKAVEDNAYSKILSGWTFRKSAKDGMEMGKQIADFVIAHAFTERD